jgi:hypothetical protein
MEPGLVVIIWTALVQSCSHIYQLVIFTVRIQGAVLLRAASRIK